MNISVAFARFLGEQGDGRRKRRWRERRVISAINYISTTAYVSAPGLKKHSFGTTIKFLDSMLHKSGRWNENSFPVGTRRQRAKNFYQVAAAQLESQGL